MTNISKDELERILADPSSCYKIPDEVLYDKRLTLEQKKMILKVWAFDAREIEVAQEENMRGDASPLRQVLLALRQLE
ncbi:MAG: hypothetical protein A3J38_02180 [Gammaproteobacteria bacterium RIFCSPHIGHO2_12_FULL_45_9]|nr:MAG: hypothetical protein A3J38_02180 [Gammaproteobacteria bacterium RIFCSPHIGHO2_12_FULL_45_9]